MGERTQFPTSTIIFAERDLNINYPTQHKESNMKLSEAILKGCEGTYQAFHTFADGHGGYCAIGAAERGGYGDGFEILDHITNKADCPVCLVRPSDSGGYLNTIPHLNDTHKWTRERIAHWVAENFEKETGAKLVTNQVEEMVGVRDIKRSVVVLIAV